MSLFWQHLIVALLVLLAGLSVVRRYAPKLSWRWQARLSMWLERASSPMLVRVGQALRPALPVVAAGCGSAPSCTSCSGCASGR